jgi:hypothetical protein
MKARPVSVRTGARSARARRGLRLDPLRARRVRAFRSAGRRRCGNAGNAGQDGEAIGEAGVGFDNLEDCRFDCRDLPIDLFEALSILTFQQRERQDFSSLNPAFTILRARAAWTAMSDNTAYLATLVPFLEGMRKAGVPER